MKVGTDGVLLGAWADAAGAGRLLDIGTGTGLLALMMAQRYPQLVADAIEIDPDAAAEAAGNAAGSPFAGRVAVHHAGLQEYVAEMPYDAIVCNPPYFVGSLKCPDRQRTTARHNDTLTLAELVQHSARLLREGGVLNVVLPVDARTQFISLLHEAGFKVRRLTMVCPTPGAPPKRMLLTAEYTPADGSENPACDTIVIEESRHSYTPEYIALTRGFYLKM